MPDGPTVAAPIRATYRLQLHAGFTFADAAAIVPYLRDLGVSHVYCSPILQAAPGSSHGYDVVDTDRIDGDRGGPEGFQALVAAVEQASMRLVIDIVPNHMAISGRANSAWWEVMRNGQASPFAPWFDIDWQGGREPGRVLAPILADHLGRMIEAGQVTIVAAGGDGGDGLVRAGGVELPLRPDSPVRAFDDPDGLLRVLDAQHYRLAWWGTADDLDHRRFFDITSLVGVRVEDRGVFDATHRQLRAIVTSAPVDEVRVDHVDGLRRPRQYLERLAHAVGPARIVVEKILHHGETLPPGWPVAGTTGYDFLAHVDRLFVDERNTTAVTQLWSEYTGDVRSFDEVAHAARRDVTDNVLVAEVDRLTRLALAACRTRVRHRDHTRRQVREAVAELLAAMPVYRTYAHPGEPPSEADRRAITSAVEAVRHRRPDIDTELLDLLASAVLGELDDAADLGERFQQVSSAVIAKGVEDTAFYRDHRLISLNEVGGDPAATGDPVAAFHRHNAHIASTWPESMLTLSTHDTKRSADVRGRISALSLDPAAWSAALRRWDAAATAACRGRVPDSAVRFLVFQTLVGAWPIELDRLQQAIRKSVREAKLHTSWITPDTRYEARVAGFAAAATSDPEAIAALETFIADRRIVEVAAITSLAQVALLLTCPGVPDIYQGSETTDISLVDPDNRRPVDFAALRSRLAAAREWSPGEAARHLTDGGAKLWLTHRLLAARERRHGEAGYEPMHVDGHAHRHVVAFRYAGGITVVPRLVLSWPWDGFGDTVITLPRGRWSCALTGRPFEGRLPIAELLEEFPVAVLLESGASA